MKKYRASVYLDVLDYCEENYIEDVKCSEDVDKLDRRIVLEYYLNWNGIIGWTNIILDILDYDERS